MAQAVAEAGAVGLLPGAPGAPGVVVLAAAACGACPGGAPPQTATQHCAPLLASHLRALGPSVVLPVGPVATAAVVGLAGQRGDPALWYYRRPPCQTVGAWVCPLPDPSTLKPQAQGGVGPVYLAEALLRAEALAQGGPPWPQGVPKPNIRTITDPAEAAAWLARVVASGAPVAWDYETNCLKPHHPEALAYTAAVCVAGAEAVAFPLLGDARAYWPTFLQGPNPKVAQNLAFEEMWSLAHFGVPVRRWVWDTMQAAHILDPAPGCSGLSYTAYTYLGYTDHKQAAKSYLEGDPYNHVVDMPLLDLLRYNAMDAWVEYYLAVAQCRQLQHPYSEKLQCTTANLPAEPHRGSDRQRH
jgi:hypothetical protein